MYLCPVTLCMRVCEYINTNMELCCLFVMDECSWAHPLQLPEDLSAQLHAPFNSRHPAAAQTYPVLVWVFYKCDFAADAELDTITSLLLQYENYRDRRDSMHVGLILGWRHSNGVIQLEPHEFGCFTGRDSGVTAIGVKNPDMPKHFSVSARRALFLRVSTEFAREFMRSFGCLYSPDSPAHVAKYVDIARAGVAYPPLDLIVRTGLANATEMSCIFGRKDIPGVCEQIMQIAEMCQCAQFSVWPLLNMILVADAECEMNGITFKDQARIRELAVVGSALHPSSVYDVLSNIHPFQRLEGKDFVWFLGEQVQLGCLELENAYATHLPNQANWALYDSKLSSS